MAALPRDNNGTGAPRLLTSADALEWRIMAELAHEAEQYLRPALLAVDRIYRSYGDTPTSQLVRLSPILLDLRRHAGALAYLAQSAEQRSHEARINDIRARSTPLWMVRPDLYAATTGDTLPQTPQPPQPPQPPQRERGRR